MPRAKTAEAEFRLAFDRLKSNQAKNTFYDGGRISYDLVAREAGKSKLRKDRYPILCGAIDVWNSTHSPDAPNNSKQNTNRGKSDRKKLEEAQKALSLALNKIAALENTVIYLEEINKNRSNVSHLHTS